MLQGIYFNKAELAFHHQQLALCKQHWGTVPSHPRLQELSGVKCHGLTVSELLSQLNTCLSRFIHYPSQTLKGMAILSGNPIVFEGMARKAINDAMTLCTYLAQTISKDNRQANGFAPELISQTRGYLLLLASIASYNLAVDQYQQNKLEPAIELVVASLKWMEDAELNHLDGLNSEINIALRKRLMSGLTLLQYQINQARKTQAISPQDLTLLINRKNQRAERFALPFNGEVIFEPEAYYSYLPDPLSLQKLYRSIQAMRAGGVTSRKQILFYFNISLGHVELLDVSFDADKNKFYFINVSSTHLVSQYHFLQALIEYLEQQKIDYDIAACQANVQRDGTSCCLYVYALAGIVAKLSPERLTCERAVEAPMFFDVSHRDGHQLPTIPGLRWIAIQALGDKASLISQSFSFMLDNLSKTHSTEEAKKLINEFKVKYGLIDSDDITIKHTYVNYLRSHFQTHLTPPGKPITIDTLKVKFNVDDGGKMMRRAVTYATTDEFDFLIEEFSKLDVKDNPLDAHDEVKDKGFTPLLLSLQRNTPGRALRLLASGKVSSDKVDAKQQSAKDYFAKLPADSALVQNPYLQRYLKK
ncbi:MAG: hypothetical protein AB7I18_13460 [Candidatus Berkiella sp.]